jgi:hypothetical protein
VQSEHSIYFDSGIASRCERAIHVLGTNLASVNFGTLRMSVLILRSRVPLPFFAGAGCNHCGAGDIWRAKIELSRSQHEASQHRNEVLAKEKAKSL